MIGWASLDGCIRVHIPIFAIVYGKGATFTTHCGYPIVHSSQTTVRALVLQLQSQVGLHQDR